jgi:hypothetical protein
MLRGAALVLSASSLLALGCRTTCTDVPAQKRTFTLAQRDAGEDAATGERPLGECRGLCGDTTSAPDDTSQAHVTRCSVSLTDAGDSVVACDETAYRLCLPDD